jgi:hypothetical protein
LREDPALCAFSGSVSRLHFSGHRDRMRRTHAQRLHAKFRRAACLFGLDPLVALGVVVATVATDAVYVMFTSAVVARRRVQAATWGSIWYVLSSFAVISYTNNWMYVMFVVAGSWIGAYITMTYLHGPAESLARPPETFGGR